MFFQAMRREEFYFPLIYFQEQIDSYMLFPQLVECHNDQFTKLLRAYHGKLPLGK